MFCPKCGAQNDDNGTFCQGCGAPLQSVQNPAVANTVAAASKGMSFLKGNFINDAVDKVITAVRDVAWDRIFSKIDGFFGGVGNWGYYLSGILGFIAFIVAGIRFNDFVGFGYWFLGGIAFVMGSILFSYTGRKLIGSLNTLVTSIPSSFSSSGVVDLLALLFFVMGFLGGVAMMIGGATGLGFILILIGIAASFICITSTKLLGVTFERCSCAEELLALITMFYKAIVRLTPFIWGIGSVVSFVFGIIGMVGDSPEDMVLFIGLSSALGLFPFIMYVAYLLYNFWLDIIRAIVSLPFKLDKIAENTSKK